MLYDRFYNRDYLLVVKQKGTEIFSSSRLDVKFSIDRICCTDICKSSISILGLDRDRINSIAKIARETFAGAQEMALEVELSAGYKGNRPVIYKGFVINASVDSPPDMWLNMNCVNYTDLGTMPKKISINPKSTRLTYSDIARSVLKQMGLGTPDLSMYIPQGQDYFESNAPISGVFTIYSALRLLQEINKDRWIVYYDMGKVFISNRNPSHDSPKVTIDKRNGLLSATNVDFAGCKIITLLQDINPSVQRAEVKSDFNIGANGIWTILGKKFDGHFRGNKWQTTFDLLVEDQIV